MPFNVVYSAHKLMSEAAKAAAPPVFSLAELSKKGVPPVLRAITG
jgi:hypothetical protein